MTSGALRRGWVLSDAATSHQKSAALGEKVGVDASRVLHQEPALVTPRYQLCERVISDLWSELQRLHLCRLSLPVAAAMGACQRSCVIPCLCSFVFFQNQ